MCGIYCVYKQSRSCQLPFCASPIFHFEIGDFSVLVSSLFVVSNVIASRGFSIACSHLLPCMYIHVHVQMYILLHGIYKSRCTYMTVHNNYAVNK